MKKHVGGLLVAGLIVVWASFASADVAPSTGTGAAGEPGSGSSFEKRLAALEQEIEDLKVASAEAKAASAPPPNTLRAFWNNGLKFETVDKAFSLHVGGRVQWDAGYIKQSAMNANSKTGFGDIPAGTEFRRLRVEFDGDFYKNMAYTAQVDFGSGAVKVKDAYLAFKDIPILGTVRAGHFYEPFGLEFLTSDKYDLFVEYALPMQAFGPDRNAGIGFYNNIKERVTYHLGLFRETDDSGTLLSNSGYAVTGRVTGLPWYADEGKKLIHLGAAYSHREEPGDMVSYSTTPEWHQSSKKFVSTGTIKNADAVDLLGLEGAFLYGPFCAQAEWFGSRVSRTGIDAAKFNGWYVEMSYFLTGENRKYDTKKAEWGRPIPNKNFNLKDGGWGAWELTGRYSTVNLNDTSVSTAKITGGEEKDFTLGVNWYWNPNARLMFNWVHANTSNPNKGDADMLLTRVQWDF